MNKTTTNYEARQFTRAPTQFLFSILESNFPSRWWHPPHWTPELITVPPLSLTSRYQFLWCFRLCSLKHITHLHFL